MSTPQVGSDFGRYHLDRLLGRGGMGMVFEAVDTTLNRPVALKIILPSLADVSAYRDRFSREASTLARIRSRHIVQIHEYGEHDGNVYLVTELFPDGDLAHWMSQHGPLTKENALTLTAQVCEGLQDAHDAGVIHRDIKPSNVLLWERGSQLIPYLCDFGIAGGEDGGLTRSGAVMGSLSYMAPERNMGHPADESGDIYSAGCLLWAALDGEPPYGGTDFQLMEAHLRNPIPRLDGHDPLTNRINDLLQTAMAKDPAQRFHTAAAFRDAILEVLSETNVHSPVPAPLERPYEEVTGYSARPDEAEVTSPAPRRPAPQQPTEQNEPEDDHTIAKPRQPAHEPTRRPAPTPPRSDPATRYVRVPRPASPPATPAEPAASSPEPPPAMRSAPGQGGRSGAPTSPRSALPPPGGRRPWVLPLAIGLPVLAIALVVLIVLLNRGDGSPAAAPNAPTVHAASGDRAVGFTATAATKGPKTTAIEFKVDGKWRTATKHVVRVDQGGDEGCVRVRARAGSTSDAGYSQVVKKCGNADPRTLRIRYGGRVKVQDHPECKPTCQIYEVYLSGFATGTDVDVQMLADGNDWCAPDPVCLRTATIDADGRGKLVPGSTSTTIKNTPFAAPPLNEPTGQLVARADGVTSPPFKARK